MHLIQAGALLYNHFHIKHIRRSTGSLFANNNNCLLYTSKFKLDTAGALASLTLVLDALAQLDSFDEQGIHDCLINLAQENGLKNGQVLWPVRVALSGLPSTPGGAVELADILGREETIKRLKAAIELLKS